MVSKTFGRVTGPLGVLFILFGLMTRLVVPPEYSWLMWCMLVIGLGGIAAWVITAFEDARNLATGRGTLFVATSAVTTCLLLFALAAVNYIAEKKRVEWDFTKGSIHTLSEQTTGILKGLDEKNKVSVTAFYRPADPEYGQLEDMLRRFKNVGGEGFVYEFVDIYKNQQRARSMSVSQSSPRVIFRDANGKEARSKETTEESLTNALAELKQGAEKKLYFLTNHGEKSMGKNADQGPGLKIAVDQLKNEGWKSEELSLLKQKDVPADAAAVIVAGPQSPLSEGEVAALKKYAEGGGRLVVMVDPGFDSGLDGLLADWGIEYLKGMIIDPESQEATWAFTQDFGEHPIATPRMSLFGALAFVFPDARGLKKGSDAHGATVTELFKTGPDAFGLNRPIPSSGQVSGTAQAGDDKGPVVLGLAANKKLEGDKELRVVAFGDSDFATNAFIRQGGNRDLILNTVQWLGGQEQKITIRPKMREKTTMAFLTAGKQVAVRFFSFTVMPLALIAAGLTVWSVRRSR